ncbi:MAG: P-loop NTPase fold protein [Anaerolineales bacterium]
MYPLLHAIKESYKGHFENLERANNFLGSLKKTTYVSAMAVTDLALKAVTNYVVGESLSLDDIAARLKEFEEKSDSLERVLSDWADNVTKLRKAFHELLTIYSKDLSASLRNNGNDIEPERIRFVILVDDLDRCLPNIAISILESIKNFLWSDKCVYVLALNQKVIHQAIATKYQGVNISGKQYLEKILNYSFYVPEPPNDDLAKFVLASLKDLAPEVLDGWTEYAFESFSATVQVCHFDNPRKLKRVLNQFLLFLNENGGRVGNEDIPNISRLIIMGEYYPDIYQLFAQAPDKAKAAFANLGGPKFSLDQFKDAYAVNILDRYPELVKVKQLFNIDLTIELYPIAEQVKDVNRVLSIQRG